MKLSAQELPAVAATPGDEVRETRSTCPYCGVGCGVVIESRGGQITGVRGDPDHLANSGRLCTKGSTLHLTARPAIHAQVRAAAPELRTTRDAPRTRCDWDAALDHVAERIADVVQAHGPDAVGLYISGQLLTEDYYVFNKLAKGLLGTNNIDTNSRLCMSSAVAGYKLTLGADAPPACYEDLDHADLVFIAGSNTAYAHPILYRRLEDARARRPQVKVIVVDPRATDTARDADLHLQILPGTDVALFHGLLHLLLWDGAIDRDFVAAHTEGFEELKRAVAEFTPRLTAQVCGIGEVELRQAAQWWARSPRVLSLYCQGLNQSASGTAKNAALINLHLATGRIGKPGCGPFSLTGQPNAMGGREVGGMANLLSAHRDLANPAHRAEVAELWGVDTVPARPGLTAVEMFEAAARGEIKVLWIVCTNPAQSLPNQRVVRAALERLELVIVQDAYASTATAAYADVLLPAATWGEKEGTVTNSERRISRVRAAVPPFAQARDDWAIATDVARRLEKRLRPRRPTLFPYVSHQDVWNEHRESTRGRDLDITGLSYAVLEAAGSQHWPFPAGAAGGKARLYGDGVFATATGRARFAAVPYTPVAEEVDARFPIRLTTGRLRDQWHGMSRTGTLGRLFGHAGEPAVQMNPADAERRHLADGDLVRVVSRRGTVILPLQTSNDVRPGEAFIAMHWGDEFVGGAGDGLYPAFGVNTVTLDRVDPASRQPELKHAAVQVRAAELPWHYVVFGRVPVARQLALQRELRRHFGLFAYAACVPFGFDEADASLLFRAAAAQAPGEQTLAAIERAFALQADGALRYDDTRRGQRRRVRVEADRVVAASLAGSIDGAAWLRELLDSGASAVAAGRTLLLPHLAGTAVRPRARVICNCLHVDESQIGAVLAAAPAEPLAALQSELKCGTNCGSCLPELRRLVEGRRG
jgi:assimilatory nitrate reductase catalytic subunit